MVEPEPWRRTGRKAKPDHFIGLESGCLVELAVYDDHGAQQGRAVAELRARGEEGAGDDGQVWLSQLVAIEDPYFDWWHDQTYVDKTVSLHVCGRQAHRCPMVTLYRNPLHMDVFRLLPGRSAMSLTWPSDDEKIKIERLIDARPSGATPVGPPAGGEPGRERGVEVGEAGIQGLANALGAVEADREAPKEERGAPKRQKTEKEGGDLPKERKAVSGLDEVIKERVASAPELSALKLNVKKKKKKKEKKKKEKDDKRKKKRLEEESSSVSSESSTSTDGSDFRLAALPQGVEKLQRLHQEHPGSLANLTLKRFNELLQRSTGGGTASGSQELPAVARAYLSQIYLVKCPESMIGLRNLRELRTLTTIADLICNNDGLRALDIALQRIKAIEVFVTQGTWTQATQLELIPAEGEQRAWFRQELKAAQQEAKAESKLFLDQWPRRRRQWEASSQAPQAEDKKEGGGKDDMPPANGGKNRKGKGKGKKGKRW